MNFYGVLGSSNRSQARRSAVLANVAAGLTAVLTGGIVLPSPRIVTGAARRLIGVRGIASDAAHLDFDARTAIGRATREKLSGKLNPAG